MSMRPYSSSRVKKRAFNWKSELQMFLLISGGHIGAPKRCTNQWRLHKTLYEGAWNVSANNSETVGHKDLRLIVVFYNISFSWLLPMDGFQFIFLLRDSENDLLILSVNNPTHMYLSDLRVYFKVELYFRVTWSRMEEY